MGVSQLKTGDKVDDYFLIKICNVKVSATNNNKYLDIVVIDEDGEIDGKFWRYKDGDEEKFKSGTLVKIKGAIVSWMNANQLRIDKLSEVTDEDNISIEKFIPSAPFKGEEMLKELKEYVDKIKNEDIATIVELIVEKKEEKLVTAPAAMKNHHSIRSGLLYHTVTMLKAGDALSKIYTFINTDLLFAGIILHDICKIDEMHNNEVGLVDEYTIEGQLLGHIIQGIKEIEVIGDKVGADKEVMMMLEHMILSHHYNPEYGSPKKPMFPEAQMLHILDLLDASLFDMKKAIDGIEVGTISEGIWSLDKRRVYKSNINC